MWETGLISALERCFFLIGILWSKCGRIILKVHFVFLGLTNTEALASLTSQCLTTLKFHFKDFKFKMNEVFNEWGPCNVCYFVYVHETNRPFFCLNFQLKLMIFAITQSIFCLQSPPKFPSCSGWAHRHGGIYVSLLPSCFHKFNHWWKRNC